MHTFYSYYIILSILGWVFHSIWLFLYFCYEYIILIRKVLTNKVSHHLEVLWFSHLKDILDLSNNQTNGHFYNWNGKYEWTWYDNVYAFPHYIIYLILCIIICISFMNIYLNMDCVNWTKYLTNFKSYNFTISNIGCI